MQTIPPNIKVAVFSNLIGIANGIVIYSIPFGHQIRVMKLTSYVACFYHFRCEKSGYFYIPEEDKPALREFKRDTALIIDTDEFESRVIERRNPTGTKNAPHRDLSQMIGERIFELIYDQGTHGYLLFGQDTPYGVRNFLRQFMVADFKRESPRMGHLMYLAFETHMALDYFIAEDFTKFCKCCYKEGDRLIEITDKEILQYIGICSSVPAEQKSRLMGDAIGTALAQYFAK